MEAGRIGHEIAGDTGARTRALVLLSGGIDSTALVSLARMRQLDVHALHVSYGQAAQSAELAAATNISDDLDTPLKHVTYSGSHFGPGEIRGRNAFLLLVALLEFAGASGLVLIGIHGGTDYRDCSPEFVDEMQDVYARYTGGAIELEAPFLELLKGDVVRLAYDLDVRIERTYSCETGNQPCGRCQSCIDRTRLLEEVHHAGA